MTGTPKKRARRAAQAHEDSAPAPEATEVGNGRQAGVDAPDAPLKAHSGLQADGSWVPAFEGQRPPFEAGNPYEVKSGNTIAVKYGAHSPRIVAPIAAELIEETLANPATAYLREPAYRSSLQAWAQAEARVRLLEQYVDGMSLEQAIESDRGKTSPMELLRKYEETASRHRQRLGLDPLSRARLGKDIASAQVDVASLLTKARATAEGEGQ